MSIANGIQVGVSHEYLFSVGPQGPAWETSLEDSHLDLLCFPGNGLSLPAVSAVLVAGCPECGCFAKSDAECLSWLGGVAVWRDGAMIGNDKSKICSVRTVARSQCYIARYNWALDALFQASGVVSETHSAAACNKAKASHSIGRGSK